MEMRLCNISKPTNATDFIKAILKSSIRYMQFHCLNMTRVFVKGRWVLSNFRHLVCYNFCYILRKFRNYIFRSLKLVSENTPKIISVELLITEKRFSKKLKILSILAHFISKIKKPDMFNFSSIKYFVKRFFFIKIWNVRVNYCGNYRPSSLIFCFTGHNLENLSNREKEIAVNSIVHYFES